MIGLNSSQVPAPIATFQVDALSVNLYNCAAELAQDAAQVAHHYLQDILAQRGSAAVILATGNTQIQFLETLIAKGGLDWSRITLFHLDEYLGIDANHPASFRRYLRDRVESQVKPAVFHYLQGDAMQPLEECDRYTKLLQTQPIDLCCLGVGENGHLAFNEPSVADFHDSRAVKLVKLDLATRQQQVDQGHFSHLEAVPQYAFTLTIPAIFSAKKILCLASKKRKASIIREMLRKPISPEIPASFLRITSQASLFLDTESASLI